jgi:hypothetical protein
MVPHADVRSGRQGFQPGGIMRIWGRAPMLPLAADVWRAICSCRNLSLANILPLPRSANRSSTGDGEPRTCSHSIIGQRNRQVLLPRAVGCWSLTSSSLPPLPSSQSLSQTAQAARPATRLPPGARGQTQRSSTCTAPPWVAGLSASPPRQHSAVPAPRNPLPPASVRNQPDPSHGPS